MGVISKKVPYKMAMNLFVALLVAGCAITSAQVKKGPISQKDPFGLGPEISASIHVAAKMDNVEKGGEYVIVPDADQVQVGVDVMLSPGEPNEEIIKVASVAKRSTSGMSDLIGASNKNNEIKLEKGTKFAHPKGSLILQTKDGKIPGADGEAKVFPTDRKSCPNGQTVGRDRVTCEFKECPTAKIDQVSSPDELTAAPESAVLTGEPVKEVGGCIAAGAPCKLLINDESPPNVPYKFREFFAPDDQECCQGMQCVNRDVAAISYYGPKAANDDATTEKLGSIFYCSV